MHKRNKENSTNGHSAARKREWIEKHTEEGIVLADDASKFHCQVCKDIDLDDREGTITKHISTERHQRLKRGELVRGTGEEDLAEYAVHGIRIDEVTGKLVCDHCKSDVNIGVNHSGRTMVEKHLYSQKHLKHANAVEELDHDVGFLGMDNFDPRAAWNMRKLALHFPDEESAINWIMEQRLLPTVKR